MRYNDTYVLVINGESVEEYEVVSSLANGCEYVYLGISRVTGDGSDTNGKIIVRSAESIDDAMLSGEREYYPSVFGGKIHERKASDTEQSRTRHDTFRAGDRFWLNTESGNPGRTGLFLFASNTEPDKALVRFDKFAYNSHTRISYLEKLPAIGLVASGLQSKSERIVSETSISYVTVNPADICPPVEIDDFPVTAWITECGPGGTTEEMQAGIAVCFDDPIGSGDGIYRLYHCTVMQDETWYITESTSSFDTETFGPRAYREALSEAVSQAAKFVQ